MVKWAFNQEAQERINILQGHQWYATLQSEDGSSKARSLAEANTKKIEYFEGKASTHYKDFFDMMSGKDVYLEHIKSKAQSIS